MTTPTHRMTGDELDTLKDLHKELWPRSLANPTQASRFMQAIRNFPEQTVRNALMRHYDHSPKAPPSIEQVRKSVMELLPKPEKVDAEQKEWPCTCVLCSCRRSPDRFPPSMSDDEVRQAWIDDQLSRFIKWRRVRSISLDDGSVERHRAVLERTAYGACKEEQEGLSDAAERPLHEYLADLSPDHPLRLWLDADKAPPASTKSKNKLEERKKRDEEQERRARKRRAEATTKWNERKQSLLEALKEEMRATADKDRAVQETTP